MDWVYATIDRAAPASGDAALTPSGLLLVLAAALALVMIRAWWQIVRLAVTLVHELGHALVGMAVGRQFVGFVIRGDMSGHTVTAGPPRGPGLVASTWAGYPAPAVVGAGMVWLAVRGWSAPVITIALAGTLLAASRVRSLLTAALVGVVLLATWALWWWRDDTVQQYVLVGGGLVLVVGAWRHILSVMRHGSGADDPAMLAQLTHLPRTLWNLTFLAVAAASSALLATQVLTATRVLALLSGP